MARTEFQDNRKLLLFEVKWWQNVEITCLHCSVDSSKIKTNKISQVKRIGLDTVAVVHVAQALASSVLSDLLP